MSEEFPCPNCRMRLEVSPDQLGRQVRCPVCGVISVFGSREESAQPDDWSPIPQPRSDSFRGSNDAEPAQPRPKSDSAWQPVNPTGSSRSEPKADIEREAKARRYVETYSTTPIGLGRPDQAWWTGFILSLLSIGGGTLPCFCCLLYPFGPTIFAISGIIVTRTSKSGPKLINYLIAAIGLISSLTGLLLVALSWIS